MLASWMQLEGKPWFTVSNIAEIDSPALLIYPDRAEENIRRMIAMAGGADRLCPHVKTHKLAELIQMQLRHGIRKFKCATIAEAEMVASAGAEDVLLAYQPVGPKLPRLVELIKRYASTRFAALCDNEMVARNIAEAASVDGIEIPLFVDIDCGMGRSGIPAGKEAAALYGLIARLSGVTPAGLHAYDGHISDSDPAERARRCDAAFSDVVVLQGELEAKGLPVPRIIAGGTPTFPIHAHRQGVECSPGTCVLWDAGYGNRCKDLDFLYAAVLVTRVVSKPGRNRLCLDLGHKAVAAENPHPRVVFLNLPDVNAVIHSEEHLVVETAEDLPIGTVLYGVPRHVCPTVALHSEAVVIREGQAREVWQIRARARKLEV